MGQNSSNKKKSLKKSRKDKKCHIIFIKFKTKCKLYFSWIYIYIYSNALKKSDEKTDENIKIRREVISRGS